jgi:hypothetical protein
VGLAASILLWGVVAPVLGLTVHECAHGAVVARHTGRRTQLRVGRGPRVFGLRLGPLEIEWCVVMIHDNCSVDLTGLRADVARSALRAGPIADVSQALLWLLAVPFAPHSALTLGGLAFQYTFWGLTRLAPRHGQKLGQPYESDGYKIRELENRVDHGVIAASAPAIDPLVDYLRREVPELLGGEAPAPASAPAPTVARVTTPKREAKVAISEDDALLAYLRETAPELVAAVSDERPAEGVAVLAAAPAPVAVPVPTQAATPVAVPAAVVPAGEPVAPSRPAVDPRAATSIAPPGFR